MKFVLKPSLEHVTLVKIGILLWNQNDVSALISKLGYQSFFIFQGEWKKIEERVIDKVLQLSLPQLLKEKVFGVIKPIGMQIFEWIRYYRKYDAWVEYQTRKFQSRLDLDLPAHLPAELCWTPQGTVDRKRTAEVLVRDENLNVFRRYLLACDHCLEDDITQFWDRLPEDLKVKDGGWHSFEIIRFWSDNMKRGGVGPISYKDGFCQAVVSDYKVASYYFLQKLTPQERKECLEDFAVYRGFADVIRFLLPEIEEEQQMLLFKSDPHIVLRCFLQWPFQSFFIGIANCLWDFLSRYDCDKILADIIGKVRDGYKDYNYQKLFREFWQKSLHALKDSLIEDIDDSLLICVLFCNKDKENIRFILKDATLTAKAKLIYSEKIGHYLTRSIHKNEWDFLEFFIRECLPSKSEMLKFKDEFERRIYFNECSATEKQKWNQLFGFSDDSMCKHVKRSVEEGESSSLPK